MVSRTSLVETARLLLAVLILAMGASVVTPVLAWQSDPAAGGLDELCMSAMSTQADRDAGSTGEQASHSHASCTLCNLVTYLAPPSATPEVVVGPVAVPPAIHVGSAWLHRDSLRRQARAPPR